MVSQSRESKAHMDLNPLCLEDLDDCNKCQHCKRLQFNKESKISKIQGKRQPNWGSRRSDKDEICKLGRPFPLLVWLILHFARNVVVFFVEKIKWCLTGFFLFFCEVFLGLTFYLKIYSDALHLMIACLSFTITAVLLLPPCRRSRCGGKGTWWGRACPTRPPSPLRGSRARPLQRAHWSKPPRRRAARPATPPVSSFQDSSASAWETPSTSGRAAVSTCSRCWDEEGRPTCSSAACEHWDRLHEAFKVVSGCWSRPFTLMHRFLFSWWDSN